MLIYNILLIAQIIIALSIIGLVLIQHGKGADAGAAFGGGSSGTVFGSRGSGNFLSRSTGILAAIFFANSLALAWLVAHRGDSDIFTSEKSVIPKEMTGQTKPAPVIEPTVPSDVPASVGNTENTKPTGEGNTTPADIPVAVDPPPVVNKENKAPSDVPTPVEQPIPTDKNEVAPKPEKIEMPKAPIAPSPPIAIEPKKEAPSDTPPATVVTPIEPPTKSTETVPADVPQ